MILGLLGCAGDHCHSGCNDGIRNALGHADSSGALGEDSAELGCAAELRERGGILCALLDLRTDETRT